MSEHEYVGAVMGLVGTGGLVTITAPLIDPHEEEKALADRLATVPGSPVNVSFIALATAFNLATEMHPLLLSTGMSAVLYPIDVRDS